MFTTFCSPTSANYPSQLHKTLANIPPTLIVHNEDDEKYVTGSKLYSAALDEVKAPHQFVLDKTGGHGYGLHCTKEARIWPQAAEKWLHEIGIK